ncbi:MAG: L-fucose isomerase [Paenibacillus macerans]|uniref:L-fucose isomerase n=1 Tax=Paenibacillus macerans TaxID=44252 RepID=A0A090ZFR1_PAEMA|nr:L-fucose isomerase [Paenibacillus macerans]KFN10144.1 L-fucose isomerase [Paenibacillus macerans]MBS5911390.1 L-fucose isomerase [Paenibacillus macerans]MCY7561498.1 L-fucose isomerase [Paenibacillus macerans]MDU5945607.1 L-fucose isomerase [Paenibacillus macerans]MDU7477477.1 L-fucose isomerase [Paenibacillus macerans]
MVENDYRWRNGFPKIGIRPTIDGRRRGVRESLEEQTMNLAKAVARLLSAELRYPNGRPVECVIADTCIGGVAEAAAAAKKFKQAEVGLSITVTPCWCYGTETMDTDPLIPKAVWGFNGTGRPGAVYLAAVLSAHAQKGLPAFGIYGEDVQDEGDDRIPDDVQEKLLRFARGGLAAAMMRDQAYLSMGSVSMGIAGSMVNDSFFQEYLGMRNEYVDMSEFTRRIEEEIFDPEEYKRALDWVKNNCQEGPDNNPAHLQTSRERKDREWETVVKMTLIARDLMIGNPRLAELGFEEEAQGHHAIASGFQGQRQWTDHFPNGDFMETLLNSSFDWNGTRSPYVVATENDSLNGVGMLFGYLLTNTAQIFADVRTYWSPSSVERVTGYKLEGRAAGGILHLINSGSAALDGTGEQTKNGAPAIKPYWEISAEEVERMLKATQWRPASVEYFRGGGFSTDYLTRGGMPMTMARLNLVKGLGPVLQIAEGYSVDLPEHVHDTLDQRTDPTWPSTWFAPILTGSGAFTSVYDVMDHWGANHGVISYGHIGADLITLASILRIPVSMHNVPKEKIFRPRAWGLFGTEDAESADFRACTAFGPLYS